MISPSCYNQDVTNEDFFLTKYLRRLSPLPLLLQQDNAPEDPLIGFRRFRFKDINLNNTLLENFFLKLLVWVSPVFRCSLMCTLILS